MKNYIIFALLLFCFVSSDRKCTDLCDYFWLNGLDLKCGCIKMAEDYYHSYDDFLGDHDEYSGGYIDKKCEPILLAYFENNKDWKKGQINSLLQDSLMLYDLPNHDYYYKLRYEIIKFDSGHNHLNWRNFGLYNPKTNKISYDGFSM